jgi:Uma2 family endonuclease
MSTAERIELVSVDDYLAGELVARRKHEYLGGVVYAMSGARVLHDIISSNLLAFLHARLRGGRCRPYTSDMKIRVRLPTQVRFYYPGCSVVCQSNPSTDSFQDQPVLICEVLSRGTRRIDEGEKKDAYLTIPSLSAYLLVETDRPAVVVHRRTEQGFLRETYAGLEAVIPLPELKTELPLSEIYEAVEFLPEQVLDEDAD